MTVNLRTNLITLAEKMGQESEHVHSLVSADMTSRHLSTSALSIPRVRRTIGNYERQLQCLNIYSDSSSYRNALAQLQRLKSELASLREKWITAIAGPPALRTEEVKRKFAFAESVLGRIEGVFSKYKGPIPISECLEVVIAYENAATRIGLEDPVSRRLTLVLSEMAINVGKYANPPLQVTILF